LGSAILGYTQPSTLKWVNQGSLISILLAAIMCGTGLTLRPADFSRVRKQWRAVPLGVLAQFTIMPLTAWTVGKLLLLKQAGDVGPALFLGLCLVGCSPGGTASNLVALIAGADVALSVVLTSCSTLLAVVATPALVQLLVGGSGLAVSGGALVVATAKVVLGPILLGMVLNQKAPGLSRWLSRFTSLASVLLVSLICGGVVAQNATMLTSSTAAAGAGGAVLGAVGLLHTIGFGLGYAIPRYLAKSPEQTARTVSIEVGMQNSALAVVLARSMGAPALACLPGALSATVHSCLGSLLAAYWRIKGNGEEVVETEI
jgi:BASS family bile acid:Na+ symporter